MIIAVHSLYFLIQFAFRWYRRHQFLAAERQAKELRQLEESQRLAALPLDPEECFVFSTPVYRQRYSTVQDVLLDARWRRDIQRVVDFGCAEFGFFQYMKHLLSVTNIYEVDIDETLLKESQYRVRPLTADFLKQRNAPLIVEILSGSIADPDVRIKNIDAVVGIEIIEHLYPDTLDALPYNIFGYAQPRVAIFTTPNADFNVLFPNFKGFRHDDHKFEWTREQFQSWGLNIVSRFPNYSVSFSGIGKGPVGTDSLGCCSQMAVFIKEYDIVLSEVPEHHSHCGNGDIASVGVCTYLSYSLAQKELLKEDLFDLNPDEDANRDMKPNEYYHTVEVIKYPYVEDVRTSEEKILDMVTYEIFRHTVPTSRYYNDLKGIVEIPLYEIIKDFEGQFVSEAEVEGILVAADFKVAECELYGGERCLCVQYDIDMDGNTSKTGSDYEPSDQHDDENDGEFQHTKPEEHTDGMRCLSRASDEVEPLRNINSSNDLVWDLDEPTARTATSKDEIATPSDPLVDSGYQKSLSNAEWSPQSPIDGHFEDQFGMTKLDVNDIKDSIKARMTRTRNGKPLNNRLLSEWGRISGAATMLTATGPCALASSTSSRKSPKAGTSSSRRRKSYSRKSDTDESDSSAKDDVQCIANDLIYNSLNKLEVNDDLVPIAPPPERPQDLEIPQFIVENGDLANNNRDDEGNNIPEVDLQIVLVDHIQDPNENLEDVAPNPVDHDADQENRNVRIHPIIEYVGVDDGIVADLPPQDNNLAVPEVIPAEDEVPEPSVLEIIDVHEDVNVQRASREALFDPNSQVDMLDDVEVASTTDENADQEAESDTTDVDATVDSANPDNNSFPAWLLELFRGNVVVSEADEPIEFDDADEPHFYCQGDGLGIHPAIVEVDIDSSSDSSSTTDDVAQAEHTISEDDVHSLPNDAVTTTVTAATPEEALQVIGLPIVFLNETDSSISNDSGADEFYDTVADQK